MYQPKIHAVPSIPASNLVCPLRASPNMCYPKRTSLKFGLVRAVLSPLLSRPRSGLVNLCCPKCYQPRFCASLKSELTRLRQPRPGLVRLRQSGFGLALETAQVWIHVQVLGPVHARRSNATVYQSLYGTCTLGTAQIWSW